MQLAESSRKRVVVDMPGFGYYRYLFVSSCVFGVCDERVRLMRGRRPIPAGMSMLDSLPSQLPDPPAILRGEALEEWNRIAPVLSALGLLSAVDVNQLAAYCQCYANWLEVERRIRADGIMIPGPANRMQLHPAARHSIELLKQIKVFAEQFGFTPLSRGRVDMPADDNGADDEPFAAEFA